MVESTKYFKAIDSMFRILLFLILFFPAYGMDMGFVVGLLSDDKGLTPPQTEELRSIVEGIKAENPYIKDIDFDFALQPAYQGADFDGMLFLLDEFRTKDPYVLVGKLYTNAIKADALKQATVSGHITALKNKYVQKAGYSPDDWIEIVDTANLLITSGMTEKHVTRIIDALEAINVSPVGLGEVIQLNSQHDINNLFDHMPEEPNIRITFGPGVGAELREVVHQTIGLYGKTVEIVANQQLQPLKQRHFVKLIKEVLAAHPIAALLQADFSIQLINALKDKPNALSRFMAIERAKEKTKNERPTNFMPSFLGAVTSQAGIQTSAEFYDSLDGEIHHLNREKFRQATLPQLPQPKLTGVEILGQFNRIISSFNLDNPAASNYLPITFVNPEAKATDNNRVLVQESIDKASAYLKTLYGLALLVGQGIEHKPKEEEIPPLKQGLEAIFAKLEHADDPSVRAMNMGLLISGLIHCSAGQKESIDTVLKTVVYSENAASSGVEEQIKTLIAIGKESVFGQIVLEPLNPENNHITSFYKHALREELGLFSSSENYRETNHQRNDQYEGNPDVVVARFYKTVTPEFLARLIFGSVEKAEDKRLKAQISYVQEMILTINEKKNAAKMIKTLENIMSRFVPSSSEYNRLSTQRIKLQTLGAPSEEDLRELKFAQTDLPTLKQQLALNKKTRPISTGDIIQYLTNHYHVDYMNEGEKDEFFRAYLDRSVNDESATLTLQGAHNLCVDLGYVFDGTDERQLTEAIRISFEDGVPKRKLARENQRIMDEFHGFQETITADYVAFKSPDKTASKAVLYLGHLREELVESLRRLDGLKDDEYEIHLDSIKVLSRKILAIIIQGQGVGGLSTRIATSAEAGIIGDVFAMAMRKAAPNIVKSYIQSKDISKLSPDAQKHEKIVWVKTQIEELKKDSEWAGSDLSEKVRLVHSKMGGVFADIGDDIVSALVR